MTKMGRVQAGGGLMLLFCGLGSGYLLTHRPQPVTLDSWHYGHDTSGRPLIVGQVTNTTDQTFPKVGVCFRVRQMDQDKGVFFLELPPLQGHQTKLFQQPLMDDTPWDAVKIEPTFMQDDSVVNTSSHPAPTWEVR